MACPGPTKNHDRRQSWFFCIKQLGLCVRKDFALQLGFASDTYLFVHNLAVFENEQGRDAAYAEASSGVAVVVHIQFANDGFTVQLFSQFFYGWTNHFTRATPLSPEVHKDRLVGVDDALKVSIGDFYCFSHGGCYQ